MLGLDSFDGGIEERADLAGADAILYVGLDPVFESRAHFCTSMNDRHARSGPKQLQSSFGGGIFRADYHHILLPVRMRIGEIMRDVREIFARDIHQIHTIVVPSGDYDFAGVVRVSVSIGIAGVNFE